MKAIIGLITLILMYSIMVQSHAYSLEEISEWTIENKKLTLLQRLDEHNDCKWDREYLSDEIMSYRTESAVVDGELIITDAPCPFNSDQELQGELDSWKVIEIDLENKRLALIAARIDLTARFRLLRGTDMHRINQLRKKLGLSSVSNPDKYHNFDSRKGIKLNKFEDIASATGIIEALESVNGQVVADEDTEKQSKKDKKIKHDGLKEIDYKRASKDEIGELLNELKARL